MIRKIGAQSVNIKNAVCQSDGLFPSGSRNDRWELQIRHGKPLGNLPSFNAIFRIIHIYVCTHEWEEEGGISPWQARGVRRQHRRIISRAGTNFRGKRKARRLRRGGVSALEVSGLSASGWLRACGVTALRDAPSTTYIIYNAPTTPEWSSTFYGFFTVFCRQKSEYQSSSGRAKFCYYIYHVYICVKRAYISMLVEHVSGIYVIYYHRKHIIFMISLNAIYYTFYCTTSCWRICFCSR